MRYFMFDSMGDTNDPSLCMLHEPPEGLGRYSYRLTMGKRIGADWPETARMIMDPDISGMKLCSQVGTSTAFLVWHRDMMAVAREICENEIEFLPLAIYNQRGKLVSTDYGAVNVIGGVDCLDEQASQMRKTAKGTVVSMKSPTIDAKRLDPDLHLFRLSVKPDEVVMSETLGRAFFKHKFTNVMSDELKVING